MRKLFVLFFINLCLLSASETIIATGGIKGNYYKIGKDLNKKAFKNRAKVLSTQGSVENMIMVADGKADIAFVQADALSLLDVIYSQKNKQYFELVDVVGKIYTETLHILVNKNSNIEKFEDLDKKVVSFGGLKSGSSVTASSLEQSSKINFKKVVDKSIEKSLSLLEKNKIDAVFYVTKAPSRFLNRFKNIKMIPVNKDILDNKLLHYTNMEKSDYKFLKKPIKTYKVDTLLIVKKGFKSKEKLVNYFKGPSDLAYSFEIFNKKITKKNNKGNILQVDQNVLVKFADTYGYNALIRYNYLVKRVNLLKSKKLVTKLKDVNALVNKLKYFIDLELCDNQCREDKGYCDIRGVAMIKHFILANLGLDYSKLKLVKVVSDELLEKETTALAYFHKNDQSPIILEYSKDKEIYKLKDGVKYKILNINNKRIKAEAKKYILKASAVNKEYIPIS